VIPSLSFVPATSHRSEHSIIHYQRSRYYRPVLDFHGLGRSAHVDLGTVRTCGRVASMVLVRLSTLRGVEWGGFVHWDLSLPLLACAVLAPPCQWPTSLIISGLVADASQIKGNG